ncbi:hypothetical protein EYF80_062455 [Liparis tanakae]|uniref:Uncharacterized protein n=1 Tax=Liparis tanakae TaxID=230148 RepID=A0A4Z2EGF8_9TELE|nr:hypothetical protein EYF80_062455 [Liparis tanakae]
MCEQAARYCRDGVHKLLNKEQAQLGAQESREQPIPVAGQDSESATAAQSGNSGAQPGGIDGLVRWIVTKMSDNKNISSREYASSKEDVAVAQEQFFTPEPRRGISVILDVSIGLRGSGAAGQRDRLGWGGCCVGMKTSSERCSAHLRTDTVSHGAVEACSATLGGRVGRMCRLTCPLVLRPEGSAWSPRPPLKKKVPSNRSRTTPPCSSHCAFLSSTHTHIQKCSQVQVGAVQRYFW